jgi:hypothetical protein
MPSWQAAQPLVTPVWLKWVGLQASVVWQVSHSAVVTMCAVGLPVACTPLWQVLQVPAATPV